jgi:hypothetical protein
MKAHIDESLKILKSKLSNCWLRSHGACK